MQNKLLGERTRVVFVSGPGYKSWPLALQKMIATVALMYRSLESTLCGGYMPIEEFMRPHRIDYPRLLSELSKTLSSMPLLEPLELTIDDCTLREHNEYMRMFQPWNERQEPIDPPKALLRLVERSMRITGDGLCIRREGQSKFKTPVSNENIGKISRKFQETRKDLKLRVPKHDTLIEIKTFDAFPNPSTAYLQAPLGRAMLRIHLNSELKMKLSTNAGVEQTETTLGAQSLSKNLIKITLPKIETAHKLTAEFGIGWTKEYCAEVNKLKGPEQEELADLLSRVRIAQVFALIGTFGPKAFVHGHVFILQECWKKQSFQQTLFIMILTQGQVA